MRAKHQRNASGHSSSIAGQPIPGQQGPAQFASPPPVAGWAPVVAAPARPGRQGPAITSLVLGIVAAVFCLVPIVGMIAIPLAAVGLVFGLVGWRGAAKGRREGKGKAIAGVVLSLVAGTLAIVMAAVVVSAVDSASKDLDRAFGNSSEQVLAEDLGVDFGSYRSTDLGFGVQDGSLSATLINKSNEAQSFSVKVEAVTAAGARIATDTALVSDLGAGQSDEVELFQFASAKDGAQLKNATFRVIEASAY